MTTAQPVEKLMDLLLRRTNATAALKWETSAGENTFRLASRTAHVRVTRSEEYDRESESPYRAPLSRYQRHGARY